MPRSLPLDYSLRNLGRRPLQTALNGLAFALVAAVLVVAVSFVQGLHRSFVAQGRSDTAILLSAAAMRDVVRSAIQRSVSDLVAADVGTVLRVDGVPAVSPEVHLGTRVMIRGHVAPGFVRGITDRAFLVHQDVTLLDGALPGPNELLVGRLAAAKLGVEADALAIGETVRVEGGTFRVSGTFAAAGTTIESELWAPLHELMGLARRDDLSAVFVRLQSAEDVADVEVFAQRRLDLELVVVRSDRYYAELAAYFGPIRTLATLMALMIAVTVVVTGANTLSATVRHRIFELATLRAIGYSNGALIRSLLVEAVLLAAAGGLIGLMIARIAVDGAAFRIGMGAFALEIDGSAVLAGCAGALLLGLVGTIPAGLRIAKIPVATALKTD